VTKKKYIVSLSSELLLHIIIIIIIINVSSMNNAPTPVNGALPWEKDLIMLGVVGVEAPPLIPT
jgi:hypothetical protein